MIAEKEAKTEYLRPEGVAAVYDVSVHTVRNWIQHGVTSAGRTVRLHAVRVGKVWRVPREAWEEFLAALNGGPVDTPEARRGREEEQAAAVRALDARLAPKKRRRG